MPISKSSNVLLKLKKYNYFSHFRKLSRLQSAFLKSSSTPALAFACQQFRYIHIRPLLTVAKASARSMPQAGRAASMERRARRLGSPGSTILMYPPEAAAAAARLT